ncbi:MAG: hypothetical protein M3Z64_11900 [Verrucomicrobiota bacterium]|nr:hypothetical protein [Verrucomicrobiota bacterium]
MNSRPLQFFFLSVILGSTFAAGETQALASCRCVVTDVDGDRLSTFDGHVTLVVIVPRARELDARLLADRVPKQYYGDPHVRLVTIVNFGGRTFRSLEGVANVLIRRRLDAEAQRLRPIYDARKLKRDPRHDLFVVADFDGQTSVRFGVPAETAGTTVLVFDGAGRLIERWSDVPAADGLAAALAQADQSAPH